MATKDRSLGHLSKPPKPAAPTLAAIVTPVRG